MTLGGPGEWQPAPAPCGDAAVRVAGLDYGARLPRFIDSPPGVADRLGALEVGVVGAGSIGIQVVSDISRLGVKTLRICDSGSTKQESLLTHAIAPSEVGLPKAELAARRAQEISPNTDVRFYNGPIQAMRRDALAGLSAVVVATDNHAAEVATTQACLHLGLPLIQASVYGPALITQIREIASDEKGRGPCLVCGYTARDFEELDSGTRFSCEGPAEATATSATPVRNTIPTRSLPHLCSLAGNLAVAALLQRYLGLGEPAAQSRCHDYCGFTGLTTFVRLERNPDCPVDHEPWVLRVVDAPLGALSPRDVIRIAGHSEHELASLALSVEGYRFAAMTACNCAPHVRLDRFLPVAGELGPCASCGVDPVVPHPLHSYADVPGAALVRCLDCPLEALGAAASPSVLVRGASAATLVRSSESGLVGSAEQRIDWPGAGDAPVGEVEAS